MVKNKPFINSILIWQKTPKEINPGTLTMLPLCYWMFYLSSLLCSMACFVLNNDFIFIIVSPLLYILYGLYLLLFYFKNFYHKVSLNNLYIKKYHCFTIYMDVLISIDIGNYFKAFALPFFSIIIRLH